MRNILTITLRLLQPQKCRIAIQCIGDNKFKIYISCLGFLTNATNPENQVFKRTSALLMPLVGYSPPLYLGSESVRKRIAKTGSNVTVLGADSVLLSVWLHVRLGTT